MKHAKLSASRIERVALCPGSFALEEPFSDTQSPAAYRGELIHQIAEKLLLDEPYDTNTPSDLFEIANVYHCFIKELADNHDYEVEVDLTPYLKTIHPHLGGTADCVIKKPKELHVVDLKTGRVPVSTKNNYQLMTYALGALLKYQDYEFENVHLHIYQPENPQTSVSFEVHEVLKFAEALNTIAIEANNPFAPLKPGLKQCKYCKAKPVCPAIKNKIQQAAKEDFMQTDQLSELLDMAELAKKWVEDIQEYAKQQLSNGIEIQGWTLKPGRKMLKYANQVGSEAYLAGNLSAFTIKTPTQLKKLAIELPEGHLIEEQASPSLVRIKNDLQ